MSNSYGDLRTEGSGEFTKMYFCDIELATCNQDVAPEQFMADLCMYKASYSRVSTNIAKVLGYLDYCHEEGIKPTEKGFEKLKLMEVMG